MDWTEVGWRARVYARTGTERLRSAVAPSRWDRRELIEALAASPGLEGVQAALAAERWDDAHRALSGYFSSSPRRFVIAAQDRVPLGDAIRTRFPDSAPDAAARADRLVAGRYDLLAYPGLEFRGRGAGPDWHLDPVNNRRAPLQFWSTVPYLDEKCGDHKIIWELNRHQHWLRLGRAYWLTGEPKYRDRFITELTGWLADNPPLTGINWASMLELGFRSLSWIWALNFFVTPADEVDGGETPWTVDLLLALDRQLTHIEHNLSYYFSPNTHLLGEALALYVAGRSLPELDPDGRRAALGRRVLLDGISRQISPDGGHCERSTHYHRYALDFYLLALVVATITGDSAVEDLRSAVVRLRAAARLLADDNGRIPLIGDDDGGELWPIVSASANDIRASLVVSGVLVDAGDSVPGQVPEEAYWMLSQPALAPLADNLDNLTRAPQTSAPHSGALTDTGYYVSRSAAGDHMVVDGGPHGYQNAGHAHADALSLTLSVRGAPLLIDPGTACYTTDRALRDRMRSTALHNTLVLDGQSQSIPDGPFHWKRTASSRVLRWRTNSAFDYFAGAHDGYGASEHRRHVLALHGDLLVVADLVSGTGSHDAAVHWHIDPSWSVRAGGRRVDLDSAAGHCELVVPSGMVEVFHGDQATGLGWYAPVYGRLLPSTSIRFGAGGEAPLWIVSVFGLDRANRIHDVDFLPIERAAGTLLHGVGLRIRRELSCDDLMIAEPARESAGATWRLGDIETDAHLLFCRTFGNRQVREIALVDGSVVRTPFDDPRLALIGRVSDLHLDNLCAA
jgi:hypothetical protein